MGFAVIRVSSSPCRRRFICKRTQICGGRLSGPSVCRIDFVCFFQRPVATCGHISHNHSIARENGRFAAGVPDSVESHREQHAHSLLISGSSNMSPACETNSHNGTRPAITPHENMYHLQPEIKNMYHL